MVRSWLVGRRAQGRDDIGEQTVVASGSDIILSEDYRTLRTNLLHSFGKRPLRVIVLTSPGPRKINSIVCANLALALSRIDKRTLIMDCDLHRPVMHKLFGLGNAYGLTDVLAEKYRLHEAWQEPVPGLRVLTTGTVAPGAADLLESGGFEDLLTRMRQEFDYVLVDTPPLRVTPDATILSTKSDGVLLLLDARATGMEPVRRAVQELRAVEANILGTVVYDAPRGVSG